MAASARMLAIAAILAIAPIARAQEGAEGGAPEVGSPEVGSPEVGSEVAPDAGGAGTGEASEEVAPELPSPPVVSPTEAVPRIAVLMLPTGEVDPAMTDALTELLISAVAARDEGVQIVGKEELQAQLGQGDAGSVECVESATCLGRVGVQLGVVEVIAGTIGRRPGPHGRPVWAFNLNRLDVRTGELLGRVFREVEGELTEILDALEESFPELYARRVQPGRLVVRATIEGAEVLLDGASIGVYQGEPVRRETVEPGTHVLRVRAPGHRDFERELEVPEGATMVIEAALERAAEWQASPLVYAGAGVTVSAIAAAIGLGVASQQQPDASLSMREAIVGFYPAREVEAIVADVMFGIAAAGAALGVIGIAISGPREPEPAITAPISVIVAPLPGGAAVSAGGRF